MAGSTAESRSGGSAAAGARRGEDKRGSFGFSAGYVAARAPPSFPSSSRICLSVVLVRPQAEESKFSVVPPAVGEPAQAHEVLGTRLHGETTSRRGSRKHWGSVGLLTEDPHGAAAAGGVGVEEPLGCRRSGCGGPLGAATATLGTAAAGRRRSPRSPAPRVWASSSGQRRRWRSEWISPARLLSLHRQALHLFQEDWEPRWSRRRRRRHDAKEAEVGRRTFKQPG